MKLSLMLPTVLAASGIFATVASELKSPTSTGLRAKKQDARRTNEVAPDRYWIAPIKNVGLKCIDNSIRAGGGKPNEICMTEGEALCIEYDYKPMGGRWQFGIKDSKLRLYDPKQEVVYEYGTDVSHVCIGEEQGFDPNRYSKERPYMTLYNEKTHKVVGSLTCDGTDGKDDENIGQSTMLKLVDQADIGPYAKYPLTIVKFKKGQTEDPEDDNSLWNIVVGDYPTDQPTDEPTMEPTPEPTDTYSPTFTFSPTGFPTLTPEPTYVPTPEPTFEPTGGLSALYGLVNFNANKCEWIAFVDTFQELQRRIAMATDRSNPAKIEISNLRPIVFEDIIDISNKYFEISCPDSDCVFDLNGYSFVTPDNGLGSPFKAEFDGMTVKNGSSRKGRDDDTYNTAYGGALMLRGVSSDVSSLVLTRCRFKGNYANVSGGALHITGDVKATITNCDFDDNTADIWDGGAIYFSGEEIRLEGCRFTANTAGDWGGAIISTGEVTEISDCTFEHNEAISGGALFFGSGEVASVNGATFVGNSGVRGGAIFAAGLDTLNIHDCNFQKNSAESSGGAIFSGFVSSSIESCNFSENSANEGGAINVFFQTATFENCHFDGNSADESGGAVFTTEASVDFLACEFNKNYGRFGGGVYLSSGSSTSSFTACHFSENNRAAMLLFVDTIVDGCTFEDNIGFLGGAILTRRVKLEIVGGTTFECNSALSGGAISSNYGSLAISDAKFTNNQALNSGALFLFRGDSSIENSLFDQNVAIGSTTGAIRYVFSSNHTIKDTVFQNNTSVLAPEDIRSLQDIQCGAGFGNCFCDADASPSVRPNITTNDLPTICSGSDVGSCSGCVPTPPSTCSSTSRADLMSRTESESFEKMDLNDIEAISLRVEDEMSSMEEKIGAMKEKMDAVMKNMAEKEAKKKAAMKK